MADLALDPAVAAIAEANGMTVTTFSAANLEQSRQRGTPPELSDRIARTEYIVPGNPSVRVRVHRPLGIESKSLPCLYAIHGGGYIVGSIDDEDVRLDEWCHRFGVVGVSVAYRLAPETPYPGAVEDCYLGLKWTYDNHERLGIDRDKIGVIGSSAGGGLAAALALLARDRGEVPLQFQLLDCPMLDDRQVTPSSQMPDLLIWSRESNTFGWRSYLGDLYGTDEVPAFAAAARAADLSGLPPAYISVGTVDGFRDEDVIYATRLNQAGVDAELHVYPGAPHGVESFGVPVSEQYGRDMRDWLGRQIARLR
jgi:acetyl esterase/lipase